MSGKFGRVFLLLGLILLLALFAWEAFASDDPRVIEVRRNIPMSDGAPVYRDYYINAGVEAGLKQNLVVTAVRKLNVKDASGALAFGEIMIPVGQIRILYVQNHLAVAREYKLLTREEYPMLEQTGIMIGDLLDLKGSFIDNKKPSAMKVVKEETNSPSSEPVVTKEEPKTAPPETEAAPRVASTPE